MYKKIFQEKQVSTNQTSEMIVTGMSGIVKEVKGHLDLQMWVS